MNWNPAMTFLAENSVLARLTVASLELLLLAVLLTAVSRSRRLSPRMLSFLWLIVLAKPVISLAIGTPIPLVHFERAAPVPESLALGAQEDLAQDRVRAIGSDENLAPDALASRSEPSAGGSGWPRSAGWIGSLTTEDAVLGLWLCGVATFALRYLIVRRRLARIVASSGAVPAPVQWRYEQIAHELGLVRPPRLRATEGLDSPALVGVLQPTLLLPHWMVRRGMDSHLEWALRHELCHQKWLDPIAIFVRDASSVLFHFHPAVWWAGRRHLDAIELACDQSCLRDSSEAPAYAESLYQILRELGERRATSARSAGLAMATRGRMTKRIAELLVQSPLRPLTRTAAAGTALAALAAFSFGLGVGHVADRGPVHDTSGGLHGDPSLFLLGPLSSATFEQIGKVASGKHSIWGRSHEEKIYDDLFENEANPFNRHKKDQLVLLLTLDPADQLPKKYEDVLPAPWSKLQARLEHGDTFEEAGSARDLEVLALGAPNRAKLDELVHSSKRFAALIGAALPAAPVTKPSLFFLGPLSTPRFKQLCKAAKGKDDIWGRGHDAHVYADLFENSSNPFHWKKGDQLVLLLTLEKGDQVPKKYEDILPKTWSELKAKLESGSSVEESGSAHDMQVLVLGAPTRSQLEAMLGDSRPLAALLGSSPAKEEHAHEGSGDPHGPDIFVMGVGSLFRKVVDNSSKGTWSKTGRAHDEAIYDEIFSATPNHYGRSDGDIMVLLFTLDGGEKLPAKYQDLLPEPWATIEAAIKKGETVELQGQARGLKIVVLAAPDEPALSSLIEKTPTLAPYRPEGRKQSMLNTSLPPGTRYAVAIDEADRRVANVRLDLGPGSGSVRLSMSEGARHVDGGYAHFLRDLSASDASGKELALEAVDTNAFSVPLGVQPVSVQYKVALEHDSSPWPEGGPDEAPYATEDDVFWTGRALFLCADFDGAEIAFQLPKDWRVSTPWSAVPERANTFHVSNARELAESFLLAGTHAQYRAKSGDAEVLLAVGRSLDPGGPRLRDAVQSVLDAGRALFGGTPPGRKLLVANRGKGSGMNGGVFGQSISLLIDHALDGEGSSRWVPFVAHEVVHLWNGGGAMRSRDHDYWFSEGFTEYYAYVLPARLGLINRDQFLERVSGACQGYLAHAGSVSLLEAGRSGGEVRALQYDGGFLAALVLDLRLRQRTASARSLDDLMRAMFERHGQTEYTLSDVAAIAADLAGSDLGGYFDRFIAGTELLPLEADLAQAGVQLESTVADVSIARDYAVHDVLRIRSLTETGDGLVVRKSADAGYQDNDRLIAIEGHVVRTFDDLRTALAGSKPGQSVPLKLVRDGAEVTMSMVLGGRDNPPMERRADAHVEVKTDTALLDGILGA